MFFFTWCGRGGEGGRDGGGRDAGEGITVNRDDHRVHHQFGRRKMTRIKNETEDMIILRDISRFVWRGDRLSLKPTEEGEIELPSAGTFLRTGVVRRLAQGREERLNIFLDDQHSKVSIRYEGGEFYLSTE